MISFSEIDISILRLVHENRMPWLDGAFYLVSFFTPAISIGFLLVLLYLCARNRQVRLCAAVWGKVVATYLVAVLASFAIKTATQRIRPFLTYPDIEKLSEAGSASFPSGHTTEAFAIAFAALCFLPSKSPATLLFPWAVLVAYSRMALGVHYPSDVFAGMAIGFMAAIIVKSISAWKKRTT